ncbi:transcriptional regulator [Neocucurbitaria cava]|uniref:Transcriptional regulator n=1 Tax=Neocucurbitaria cava TaxID=798079 RepID=A0A9W9CH20_9PLEO|nr:transcriptional regulator [Neocucurbitaria cava]
MGGAPGLSNAQSRTNGAAMSSFAQAMGGSQPHTPLNLEEFPSLSGAPQAQQNTTAQQMWANPNLRTTQQQTIQRPQGHGQQQGQGNQAANQQIQTQSHDDSSQSQFSGAGDDYRFGGQGGVGQLGGSQPQTGNIEEFPPLGGAGGEIGPDRRAGLIQNAAAFGSNPNTSAFPGLGQTRNGLPSPTDSQQDRAINPTVGGRGLPSAGETLQKNKFEKLLTGLVSRTPFDNMRSTPTNLQEGNQRTGQAPGNLSFLGPQIGVRGGGDLAPGGQRSQTNQFEQTFGTETSSSPSTQTLLHKKLADMTDSERYGLPGLLSMIPLESQDYSSLAMGQDLTVLGLDLSRPDNSPLHPTFGSPFVESNVKPVIPPDFTLPAAYTVTNVPPLHSKMTGFTAETLLAIFYQFPRDILQEIAAQELYNRDWRWHIKLQQWMMKDPDLPAPIRLSPKEERGWYLFFDVTNWRRERYLETLSAAVREMTPYGALPVPAVPRCFNLLARPVHGGCRICGLPGHHSNNINNAVACHTAIVSLIGFWEDITNPVSFLYRHSGRFKQAIEENEPTYEMRNNDGPVKGGDIEVVLVDHLTKNYLKFQAFWQKIRPQAHTLLAEPELMWFVSVSMTLDGFLLNRLSRKFMTRQWDVQS